MVRITGGRGGSRIDDRRNRAPSYAAGGGAAGGILLMLFRFIPFLLRNKAMRTLLFLGIVAFGVGWFVFPNQTKSILASVLSGSSAQVAQSGPTISPERSEELGQFTIEAFNAVEDVWEDIYADNGERYCPSALVLYRGGTESGCGYGQAAFGPFYCPAPDPENGLPSVYIDLSFFEEMDTKLNAGGDFAYAYVVAHEIAHHVQNLNGTLGMIQDQRRRFGNNSIEANRATVRIELQADCLAGVWAHRARNTGYIQLDPGDVEEAINAARAVGDDTIQKKATGKVVPDSFTHGTSAQRMRWLKTGLESGIPAACDTLTMPYERL